MRPNEDGHQVVKWTAVLIALTVVVAACADSDSGSDDDAGTDLAELMAAALLQVVTVDHTFGQTPPPFSDYLVQSSLDPAAGSGVDSTTSIRPLTEAERAAIEEALSALGSVQFIDDPDEWRTSDLRPTVEGGVILGVGPPDIDGDTALVPVSMWCGGLCGTWLTYRIERSADAWTVTGIEGPIVVS